MSASELAIQPPTHSQQLNEQSNKQKATFSNQGVACAATLHKPESGSGPYPTILMVHGWGGTQLTLVTNFIEAFNKAGLAVMTFDYPGWGESEGLPRNVISPWKREKTVEAALAFTKSHAEVDATNIVLWGSSFGGGHVVKIAAEHPELRGAIAQVPMLDGMLAVKAVPLPRMMRFGLDITLDMLNPFNTHYVPIVSPEGEYSSMDRDGAWRVEGWIEDNLKRQHDNRVAARSLATMGFYRPGKHLKRIQIPTLVIGATRDTVAPFDKEKVKCLSSEHVEIKTIDANHFDPYLDHWFEENIAMQLAFVKGLIA
ncbi:alpha/beta hydrolase [Thalassolituus maritimus]|uniref:Alpha/beta fold hydrolase n=1 Tax=Thalassolituus maritimus TaxID=484498 RepID=A0ABQ0A0M8_9GAMM